MKQNNATAKALEDETPVSDEAPEDLFDEGFYYNEDEEKKKKEQTNSTNNSNIDIADISRKTLRLVNEAQRDWLTTGRRYLHQSLQLYLSSISLYGRRYSLLVND
jgi:phosphoribosylformylglycinamidine (FGAM) synthase-like enzyme